MSPLGFLLIIVAFGFIWFALLRPQKRKQLEQAQMWQELAVGDEVVTAGGLYGDITGFQDDDVLVEIAPQLEVRIARRAIAAVVAREEADEDAAVEAESYSEDAS